MLTELARIRNRQSLLGGKFDMLRIDVSKMFPDQRKEALDQWFNHHLHCVDGYAHRWTSHHWLPDLQAWLWRPCEKCGVCRLAQTNGNTIMWHRGGKYAEALIMNKDFEKLERNLATFWGRVC